MMTADQYNERVRTLARQQPLRGVSRFAAAAAPQHKWKVSATRLATDRARRIWRVEVGTGCVNDEPAAISYLRTGDPRGWEMPPDYPPFRATSRVLGADHPFVDRPMWDAPRPFLLVTAPDEDGTELGGFARTPDLRRPPIFRTVAAWEKELYHASVWVSVTFWRPDPALDLLRLREAPRRLQRWRVFTGGFPTRTDGVRAGQAKELARLYLLRTPGKPEADALHVQQLTFWNLRARAIEPTFGLNLSTPGSPGFGGIGGGLADAAAAAFLAIGDILLDLLAANVNADLAATGSVEFWSV